MKSRLAAFIAVSALMGGLDSPPIDRYEEPEEVIRERNRLRGIVAERKRNIANGLTLFHYGENEVWALNQKSADRKAKRKGYL